MHRTFQQLHPTKRFPWVTFWELAVDFAYLKFCMVSPASTGRKHLQKQEGEVQKVSLSSYTLSPTHPSYFHRLFWAPEICHEIHILLPPLPQAAWELAVVSYLLSSFMSSGGTWRKQMCGTVGSWGCVPEDFIYLRPFNLDQEEGSPRPSCFILQPRPSRWV